MNHSQHPNVILVMTDDQGYADLGCTGNPWIQTPNIDAFHDEAARLNDFHVSPLCTPTRGALMSGRRPVRNGAWATCWGRSILKKEETTMADIFSANGYRTGMFGKWHLGDNYPYRPQDRGFQDVVAHKGGGVGQTPDFWGNNYFDDTYFHSSGSYEETTVEHDGYCTDIWFGEAIDFIEKQAKEGDQPFFAYLVTNAPHSPYLVADHYTKPYKGNPDIPEPAFYGMITNIDENFGRLRTKLDELGIADNTILIFMTDNGSSGGCELDEQGFVTQGYNAGMRGRKGSYYDGGHRAPFFIRWPDGGLDKASDIEDMTLHIDILPTLIDLCRLDAPADIAFDGESLAPLLHGKRKQMAIDRVHFLQYRQDTTPPEQWTNAVMTRRWRLVYGRELYDIVTDPGQQYDVADQRPDIVARLRQAHDAWWADIRPGLDTYAPLSLGNDAENPAKLNAMDVMGDVAWHQTHIILAERSTGQWTVDVEQPGTYRFSLRRWPEELNLPIDAGISPDAARRHIYAEPNGRCNTIQPDTAILRIFELEEQKSVASGDTEVTFELALAETGITELEAWFVEEDGKQQGAYYVAVERL